MRKDLMMKIASITTMVIFTLCASMRLGSAGVTKPAGSLLDVLPDGTAVALIDFQKISNSGLWTVLNAQDDVKHAIDKTQSEMTDLGLKLSDLHTVALVFPSTGAKEPAVA